MLFTMNRVRLFGLLVAATLLIYPFIEVATTFACTGGSGSACGG